MARPTSALRSLPFVALALGAAPAAPAQQTPAAAVARGLHEASQGNLPVPLCEARKTPNARVKSARDQLERAVKEKDAAKREGFLAKAAELVNDVVAKGDRSASALFYQGRVALHQGDVALAAKAFDALATVAPDCELEQEQLRRVAWGTLVNDAGDLMGENKLDEATAYYGTAAVIYAEMPQHLLGLGVVYISKAERDSALKYMGAAYQHPMRDSVLANNRVQLAINYGILLQEAERHAEAIPVYRQMLAWEPQNVDAKRNIGIAFRAAGMPDSAEVYESAVFATVSASGGGSVTDFANVGVSLFNQKKFGEAAAAFEKALALEPNNRVLLFNTALAYDNAKDGANLSKTADRLLALDPLNEDVHKLKVFAGRHLADDAMQNEAATRFMAFPVGLEVKFTPGPQGAVLDVTAKGRDAMDAAGNPLKDTSVQVRFDFLDQAGQAVASEERTYSGLAREQTKAEKIQVKGAGIVAWSYAWLNAPGDAPKPAPRPAARRR